MSSALCDGVVERIADEQNPPNKKANGPRAHAGGMPGFVPTDEQRDCNRSPPTQAPLRFAVLPEATAVPRWHRSQCLIPIIGRANCRLLILGSA